LHLNQSGIAGVGLTSAAAGARRCRGAARGSNEDAMAQVNRQGQIVETAKEARQGERGPSVLMVLLVSTGALAVIFALLWYFVMR